MIHPDDPEDLDPVMARERTRLAWTRTAISFAAVGAAVLKTNVAAGIAVLVMAPLIWQSGRMSGHDALGRARPRQLLLTTLAVTAVALVVLAVVLLDHGKSQGFHPPLHVGAVAKEGR
jgi:uncharacterized membrane protein YidH (DUF202 family)